MKKLFFTLALFLCVATVSAQTVIVEDEALVTEKPMPKKRGWAGYETRRFFDNWEIGVSGGVQYLSIRGILGKDDPGKALHHFHWQANFNLTKWFHPVMGARLQVQGGVYQKNLTGYPREYMKAPMIFPHVDFMVNMSNWIGGERDDRAYYAVLFAGFGYHATGFTDKFQKDWVEFNEKTNQSFAFTAGLLNKFRVARGLDIELELKGWVLPSDGLPSVILPASSDKMSFGYSATLGLAYRFNKRGWKQASPYTPEDIAAYRAAVAERDGVIAAVVAENDELTDDLAAAEAARRKAEADAAAAKKAAEMAKWGPNTAHSDDIYLTGRNITFFNIGSSELTAKEKVRLDVIATQIKGAPKSKVYLIEGHADAATGTKATNRRLAEARAKKVYDYLISKGVKAENLTYKGYGDTEKVFKTADENRMTIIR